MNPLRQTHSMDRHLRSSTGKTGVVRPPPPPTTPKPQKKSRLSVPDEGIEAQAIDTSTETADVSVSIPQIDVPADQQMDESAASSKTAGKKSGKTQKGKVPFVHEGHTWHLNSNYKDSTYYRCAQRDTEGCKVTLSAKKNKDGSFTYKQNGAAHTHTLDARITEVKVRVNKAKKNAQGTGNSSRGLYAESLSGAPEEIVAQMPKQNNFAKIMRDQRKGQHPRSPKSLAELVLPNVLTTTGENFVLYDSRNDLHKDDLNNRIIVLATQTALDFLATCKVISMDGTFSSAPMLFEQMYTIQGCQKNFRMPLVFALCTNKQETTYKIIFEQLKKNRPQFKPKKVTVDFELAAINAVTEVFPNADIQGCLFHLKQSVIRNLNSIGLKTRYESDPKFGQEVRQMVAVAFLPEEKVISTWERFIEMSEYLNKEEQKKDSAINYFVNEYFCKYYIGTLQDDGQRKRPRFAIGLWNVHSSTLNDEARTNNSCEGWHNAFVSMNGAHKQTIYKWIDMIKQDEDISRGKMILCKKGDKAPAQKPQNAKKNEAIKNAVLTYLNQTSTNAEKGGSSNKRQLKTKNLRAKWLNTPEMVLLMAIEQIFRQSHSKDLVDLQ